MHSKWTRFLCEEKKKTVSGQFTWLSFKFSHPHCGWSNLLLTVAFGVTKLVMTQNLKSCMSKDE